MRNTVVLAAIALALTATPSRAVPPHGKAPVPPPGPGPIPPPIPVNPLPDPTPPPDGDEPIPGGNTTPKPTPPPAPKLPLRIGVTTWIAHAPGFVAAGGLKTAKGSIYEKKGVDVELILIDDPAEARAKFGKGELDLVTTTLDAFASEGPMWGTARGKIVLVESWSRGADGVVVGSEVAGVEDLGDHAVGVIDSTASRFLIGYLIEAAGLNERGPPDVLRLPDGASVKDEFRKKTTQAAVLWEPYLSEALSERQGARKLITTSEASGMIADVLIAREEVIARDAERLQKLVDGWYAGLAELRANPKAANAKVAAALSLDAPDVTAMLVNVALAGRDDTLKLFEHTPGAKGEAERPSHFDRLAAAAARVLGRNGGAEKASALAHPDFVTKSPAVKTKKAKEPARPAKTQHLLRFGQPLKFAAGADAFDATADAVLDRLGELLTFIPAARVRVEPTAAGRGALSLTGKKRAAAVQKRLAERFAIPATRVLPPLARPAAAGTIGAEDIVWISVEL